MKYIGNMPELNIIHSYADRYDYVNSSVPTISINPSTLYATWLNTSTGEVFICNDNTNDANAWVGQMGYKVGGYIDIAAGIYDSFPAPTATNYGGLAFDGTNLISCDGSGTSSCVVYVHDGVTSTVTSSFTCNTGTARGMMFYDSDLFILSLDTAVITRYDGISSTVKSTIQLPLNNEKNNGICMRGDNLVSVSYDDMTLTEYVGLSGTISSIYSIQDATNVTGISFYGKYYIITNHTTDTVEDASILTIDTANGSTVDKFNTGIFNMYNSCYVNGRVMFISYDTATPNIYTLNNTNDIL